MVWSGVDAKRGDPVAHERKNLVRHLWPDKRLYGATLLLVTGITGLIYGVAAGVFEFSYSNRVPTWVATYPAWAMTLASTLAALLAIRSLHTRRAAPGIVGALAGALALGFLGIGSVLAFVALAFLLQSIREGEEVPASRTLAADLWPDKTLAASAIMLVAGAINVAWGAALMWNALFENLAVAALPTYGLGDHVVGAATLAAGLLGLAGAVLNQYQQAPVLGVAGAVASAATLAGVFVAPLLGAAALVLVVLGLREHEYVRPAPA